MLEIRVPEEAPTSLSLYEKMYNVEIYDEAQPEWLTSCIFVFAAREDGKHGKGSSHWAIHKCHARHGKTGPTGQAHGLVLMDDYNFSLPTDVIEKKMRTLTTYVRSNKTNMFLIADFTGEITAEATDTVAKMLKGLRNCKVPRKLAKYLLL